MTDAELEDWVRGSTWWGPERFEQGLEHMRETRELGRAHEAQLARQRVRRQQPNPEALFTPGGELTSEEAQAVLAALGGTVPKALQVAQASAAIEAYFVTRGWKRVRSNLMAPSGQRRIVLKSRVLRVEEGGPGKWQKTPTTELREIRMLSVAQALVDAVCKRLGVAPSGGSKPTKAKKAKAKKATPTKAKQAKAKRGKTSKGT